jgi:hypothetical protein
MSRRSGVYLRGMDAVAIGTGALAIFTGGLAWATWRMAQAAERQSALALVQVQRAHRPVLVPLQRAAESLNFRGGTVEIGGGPQVSENPSDRDDLPHFSAAFLPVENVGMGPALNVRGSLITGQGHGAVKFPTEGIAARGRGVVTFETLPGVSVNYSGNDNELNAVVEYDDVAGTTYRTRIRFDVGSNAYRSELEPSGEVTVPARPRLPRLRSEVRR